MRRALVSQHLQPRAFEASPTHRRCENDWPRRYETQKNLVSGRRNRIGVWMAQGLIIGPKNKRLLDIAVAMMLFPFAILVGFPFALAVWLEDRHAPFFAAPRVGKGWKP